MSRTRRTGRNVAADKVHADIAAGHQRNGDPHAAGKQHRKQREQDERDLHQLDHAAMLVRNYTPL